MRNLCFLRDPLSISVIVDLSFRPGCCLDLLPFMFSVAGLAKHRFGLICGRDPGLNS
jgi:hypothetical protein